MVGYRGLIGLSLTALVVLGAGSPAMSGQEYLFGGSQLDNGNDARLGAPSTDGRHASNGPTYGEYLPTLLGLGFQPSNGYAYGGATSGNVNIYPLFVSGYAGLPFLGLQQQIDAVTSAGLRFQSGDLLNINAAQNDYLLASAYGTTSPAQLMAVGDQLAKNLGTAVTRLNALGAPRFVVATPSDYWLNPLHGGWSTQNIEAGVSEGSRQIIATMQAVHNQTGADILVYNAELAYKQFLANPEKYGFTNTTVGCAMNGTCLNGAPSTYLFVDTYHPTTYGHAIIAAQIANLLQAPASAATGVRVSASNTDLFGQAAIDHLDDGPVAVGKYVVSVKGLGAFGSNGQVSSSDGWVSAYKDRYSSGGGTLFIDYGLSNELTVSGMFGGVETRANNAFSASYNGSSINVGASAVWRRNGWVVDGAAGAVFTHWDDITRPGVMLGNLTASTNAQGEYVTARVTRFFDYGAVSIGPILGLSYRNTNLDSYSESGDQVLAYWFDGARIDGLFGQAGLRFESRPISAAFPVWFKGSVIGEYNFSDEGFTLTSAPINAFVTRNLYVSDDNRLFGRARLEAGWNASDQVRLSLSGSSTFGRGGGNMQLISGALRVNLN